MLRLEADLLIQGLTENSPPEEKIHLFGGEPLKELVERLDKLEDAEL